MPSSKIRHTTLLSTLKRFSFASPVSPCRRTPLYDVLFSIVDAVLRGLATSEMIMEDIVVRPVSLGTLLGPSIVSALNEIDFRD